MELKDLQVGANEIMRIGSPVKVNEYVTVTVKDDTVPLYATLYQTISVDLTQARETVQKRMDELERELQLLTQWKFLAGCVLKGWNPEPEDSEKDVHTEHCCLYHGCKYGDEDNCTVTTGKRKQSFPCEVCRERDG